MCVNMLNLDCQNDTSSNDQPTRLAWWAKNHLDNAFKTALACIVGSEGVEAEVTLICAERNMVTNFDVL